jgi:hypothetical protein
MGVGGQRHAPVALAPGKKSDTHCVGGWVSLTHRPLYPRERDPVLIV